MVSPSYYPIIGGTETFIENMSIKLNAMGTPTDIMTFSIDQTWKPWSINKIGKRRIEKINGVNIIRIPALTFLPTRIMFGINFIPGRFVDKFENYDIIHFHNDIDLSFPIFSYLVEKPKIFHCHLANLTYNLCKINPIRRYLFKKVADLYIVPSNFCLKLLFDLGISETEIRVVPNAVDIKKFKPSREAKNENLLLYIGRLHPTKGLLTLLQALNVLETSVKLVIIGPPSNPWFFKKILKLINRINDRTIHKVIYLGVHTDEKLIEWYQKASILVCPSLSESFGIVNIEAMSCATPVVATRVGGIPDVVKDFKNGILVPPNDAVKLAEAIQYLLDNEDIRIRFGEEGRKWVIENFSSEAVAKRLCKIYEKMV